MPNTVSAHVLIRAARDRCTQFALTRALSDAYFLDGVDLAKTDALASIAIHHGFDRDEVVMLVDDEAERAAIRDEARALGRQGVSGVPFRRLRRHARRRGRSESGDLRARDRGGARRRVTSGATLGLDPRLALTESVDRLGAWMHRRNDSCEKPSSSRSTSVANWANRSFARSKTSNSPTSGGMSSSGASKPFVGANHALSREMTSSRSFDRSPSEAVEQPRAHGEEGLCLVLARELGLHSRSRCRDEPFPSSRSPALGSPRSRPGSGRPADTLVT